MTTQGVQMKFQGVQNANFDENPHENQRIKVILGCAISSIAHANHRCTGGWLILWLTLICVVILGHNELICKCNGDNLQNLIYDYIDMTSIFTQDG